MALYWTGKNHVTYEKTDLQRDFDMVYEAGRIAREAVLPHVQDMQKLANAINLSYAMQRGEGMDELPNHNELAKKYCGGGWGGYAMYLFANETERSKFLKLPNTQPVEPFCQ
jgi:hypothetical protein